MAAEENRSVSEENTRSPKYDASKFISVPILSSVSTLKVDCLQIQHSFGYECLRRSNLYVLDAETLIFVTGNLIHFLDIPTKCISFRKSANGAGISCITVHPKEPIFAVAERGHNNPDIIIYSWPDQEILSILRDGTTKQYSCITFSSCGTYLASQGDLPDQDLTIWKWQSEAMVARKAAPAPEHYQLAFAHDQHTKITSCGPGHVTFWTLTSSDDDLGERLRATEGRFMMTSVADVESVAATGQTGKVVSTCHWGNLLVWEEGHIQLEVTRKDGSTCHEGQINHIIAEEGELITIGCDGWIRVWDLESICNARATDSESEKAIFHLDPMNEVEVEPGASLMCIAKSKVVAEDNNDWFIQDGSGSIWKVDLSFSLSMQKPSRIYRCHAGEVTSLTGSRMSSLVLSGGIDGKACIYDINRKVMVNHVQYSSSVTAIRWLPLDMDPTGNQVILGYADGVVRLFALESETDAGTVGGGSVYRLTKALSARFRLINAVKPHTDKVTMVAMLPDTNLIVTGSTDKTLFFFKFVTTDKGIDMDPIRCIELDQVAINFQWMASKVGKEALLIFETDEIWTIVFPDDFFHIDSTLVTFLDKYPQVQKKKFSTPDLQIIKVFHAQELKEFIVAFVKAADEKIYVLQCLLVDHDMEVVRHEVPPAISANGQPGEITAVRFWPSEEFVILGYSNGILRVHKIYSKDDEGQGRFMKWTLEDYWLVYLHDAQNGAIREIYPIDTLNGHLVLTCAADGSILVHQVSQEFEMRAENARENLKDLEAKYGEAGEKPKTTAASGKAVSALKSKIKLTWEDAAVIGQIDNEKARRFVLEQRRALRGRTIRIQNILPEHVQDIEDPNHMSLEEEKRRTAEEKQAKAVETNKLKIQRNLASMKIKFKTLQSRNEELPRDFRLKENSFQMTTFIFDDIAAKTESRLNLVRLDTDKATEESKEALEKIRRRFFDDILFPKLIVKAVRSKQELSSFRIGRHQPINLDVKIEKHFAENGLSPRDTFQSSFSGAGGSGGDQRSDSDSDYEEEGDSGLLNRSEDLSLTTHLRSRQMNASNLDTKIVKALKKQEEKREKRATRKKEYQELYARRPKEGEEDPVLVEEIRKARENVGMYVRKTSLEYEETAPIRFGNHKSELIMLLNQIRQSKEQFNNEVMAMKTRKEMLLQELEDIQLQLIDIQYRLDASKRKPVPTIPIIYPEERHQDPFHIDDKEVSSIKVNLQQEEEEKYVAGSRMSISSRRSSVSSAANRLKGGGRMGRAKDQAKETASQQHAAKKKEREKDRGAALADLSKLGNLGALTGLEIEEEEEEDEVFDQTYDDQTSMEGDRQNSISIRLETEQNAYIKRMEESTKAFDIDLLAIIEKKKDLSVNLKFAELTILAMYEELQIVRSTEKTEDELKQKVTELGKAVTEACQLVARKEAELVKRTKAVQRANDQLKTIQETIENELADNKHCEYLLKVFKMRDASKTKANVAKGDKSITNTETSSEKAAVPAIHVENLKADLKAGVDDLKHPADIDHDALKLVMDFRAKRDQIEADVKQEEANIVNLTRELSQAKVQRRYQRTSHQEAIKTAQDFSDQKRSKLNEITTVVLLCRDQLKITTDRIMSQQQQQQQSQAPVSVPSQSIDFTSPRPVSIGEKSDLQMPEEPEMENIAEADKGDDPLLIFADENLKQLQRRTEELKTERAMQKNKFKDDRQAYLNLQSDCKDLKSKIDKLDGQCSIEMVKRFGEGVSMQDIESFAVNRTLEEMKESSKSKEQSLYDDINSAEATIREAKTALSQKTQLNTELIERKTNRAQELILLGKSKERSQEILKKADERLLQDAKDEKELGELIGVYKSQENELFELRARLARFMTKGAPLLPLTTARVLPPSASASEKRRGKSNTRSSSKSTEAESSKGVVPKTIEEPSSRVSSSKKKRPKTSSGVKRTAESQMKNEPLLPATKTKAKKKVSTASASPTGSDQPLENGQQGLFVQSTKLSLSSNSSSGGASASSRHRRK